jgi:hypothetical protein
LSCAEIRRGVLRLGASALEIVYPASLDRWFDGALGDPAATAPAHRLTILEDPSTGRFSVQLDGDRPLGRDLATGDALATVWERAAYVLVDGLADAAAIHGAVAVSDRLLVLIPGATGAGKTRLSLWGRLHGFDLLTDEVVALAPGAATGAAPRIAGALSRPLILKESDDPTSLLRPGEQPVGVESSGYGHLLRLDGGAWPATAPPLGLILFPRFKAGSDLKLSLLTPGDAAARLLECCLNVRNLPRGGLPILGAAAQGWPAVALDYGATEQLSGRLDLLLRLHGEHTLSRDDLGALCVSLSGVPAALSAAVAPAPTVPAKTEASFPRRLTIGMATFDDYDGVYFTIQSIRLANPELRDAIEFIVVDNNPGGPCSQALADLAKTIDGYRYIPLDEIKGTWVRHAVFQEAASPVVLCLDCHVLVVPGALAALLAFFDAHPHSRDLVQGPLLYDDMTRIATHWEPAWSGGMLGTWASDPRGESTEAPAFDIPMQGAGLFACRRDAWPGFNPLFRGFGGEEGYIHEKIRQRGGRTLCLPALRWVHRFARPMGVPYRNRWEDRIRNYFIGFNELGLETGPMEAHFAEILGAEVAARILADIRREFSAD